MKYILTCLLAFYYVSSSFAQETFSLKLELVKPTGKVDSTSYFQVTLTNKTDSTFVITNGCRVKGLDCKHTYLRNEILYKNGEKYLGEKYQSFEFVKDVILEIPPRGSVSRIIPLFREMFDGILPPNISKLQQISKVRLVSEKFAYVNMGNVQAGLKIIELRSNWLNINGNDFVPRFKKVYKE